MVKIKIRELHRSENSNLEDLHEVGIGSGGKLTYRVIDGGKNFGNYDFASYEKLGWEGEEEAVDFLVHHSISPLILGMSENLLKGLREMVAKLPDEPIITKDNIGDIGILVIPVA